MSESELEKTARLGGCSVDDVVKRVVHIAVDRAEQSPDSVDEFLAEGVYDRYEPISTESAETAAFVRLRSPVRFLSRGDGEMPPITKIDFEQWAAEDPDIVEERSYDGKISKRCRYEVSVTGANPYIDVPIVRELRVIPDVWCNASPVASRFNRVGLGDTY